MPLTQGQMLQTRYRVTALLAQGGFGAVYRAWVTNLNQPVAIKENLDTSPEAQRQFAHEAQMLSSLRHPNLPSVIDYFVVPGVGQYLVMDFIEGEDLQTMLTRLGHALSPDQVLNWIDQICEALAYLHACTPPIIHRDVKPANIKITPQGKAVLVDFGISKIYDPVLRTTVGARAVTPGYSPLEQYGQGNTDARSDIYALGATLYMLLTGQEPQESVQRVIADQLQAAHQINPQLPPALGEAIHRALVVNPTGRYQTASEFRAALATAEQTARREHLAGLLAEAVAAQQRNDYKAAAIGLQQILAVEPGHAPARLMLSQIEQHREGMRRYRALASTIAQARVEANALRQISPLVADPDGVLRLLTTSSDSHHSSPVSMPQLTTSPVPRVKWGMVVLIASAIFAAGAGLLMTTAAAGQVTNTAYSQDLSIGDFLIGLGIGFQIGGLLLLNVVTQVSRLVKALSTLSIGIGTMLMINGLTLAGVAARYVPQSADSQSLALGNFLMAAGLSSGVTGLVWLVLARKKSLM